MHARSVCMCFFGMYIQIFCHVDLDPFVIGIFSTTFLPSKLM
jgi:hypothetical protein